MRRRVLVALEHDGGSAGVVRDHAGTWLSGMLEAGGGTGLADDGEPAIEGLSEDRTATGGVLPDGAVRAVVVDAAGKEREAAVGDGAWVAVLDEPPGVVPVTVRFHDAAGRIVRRPSPSGPPLEDALTPCPACGAQRWTAAPGRGERDGGSTDAAGHFTPSTVMACAVCGHAERSHTFYGLALDHDAIDEDLVAASAARDRDHARVLLAALPFARTLAHEVLPVLDEEPWPDVSAAAVSLWVNHRARVSAAVAAAAEEATVSIDVDGEARDFVSFAAGDAWSAASVAGGLAIVLGSVGVDRAGLRLAAVDVSGVELMWTEP